MKNIKPYIPTCRTCIEFTKINGICKIKRESRKPHNRCSSENIQLLCGKYNIIKHDMDQYLKFLGIWKFISDNTFGGDYSRKLKVGMVDCIDGHYTRCAYCFMPIESDMIDYSYTWSKLVPDIVQRIELNSDIDSFFVKVENSGKRVYIDLNGKLLTKRVPLPQSYLDGLVDAYKLKHNIPIKHAKGTIYTNICSTEEGPGVYYFTDGYLE